MPIFNQGDNTCYFIHIPRTGGRYVSSLFENSENVRCDYHKINTYRFGGIDSTHLHYPLYYKYFKVDKVPHIAIVRNPYDKFLSSIRDMYIFRGFDYNKILFDKDSVMKFIDFQIKVESFHNNWFLPQTKFISPQTYFWKYEWGFGKRFRKWVYTKTKIQLTDSNVEYEKLDGERKINYNLILN